MTGEEAEKIGRIDCRGKHQGREEIDVEQKACNKNSNGRDACEKSAAFPDGQSLQDPEIEQIGKEHVPLEDSNNAHHDERVDNIEEVMIDLNPIGRRANCRMAARRADRKSTRL